MTTFWLVTLDDGCTMTVYSDTPRSKIGDHYPCRHSPCVRWDPDTGEERKHERDRTVTDVRKVART